MERVRRALGCYGYNGTSSVQKARWMKAHTASIYWLGAVFLILLSLSMTQTPLHAQGGITPTPRPVSDDEVNRVAKKLYCPVCENVPLDVCPTDACERWRAQVRDLLAQGYSEEQVRTYFADRFGEKVVGTPINAGTQFLTITLPQILVGVFGIGAVILIVRWRRAGARAESSETETPPANGDEYRNALEDELKKRF